jgi:hypothetical protein
LNPSGQSKGHIPYAMNLREKRSAWSWTSDHLGGIALALTAVCLLAIYLCFLFGGFLHPGPNDQFTRSVSECAGVILQFATILAIIAVARKPKSISGWIAILLNLANILLFLGLFPFSLFFHRHS